jgi:formate dehydrogenase iron-sulfur subunit
MSKGILYDSNICIGCGACSAACKESHHLSGDPNPPELGADSFTVIKTLNGIFTREFCRHCLDPACASACPVGALLKTAAGPVVYDADICIGCRYCFVACPYKIPRYEWSKAAPRVRKCDMCAELQKQGKQTACAEICPTSATKFGERPYLLNEAKARIATEPKKYFPHVFGELEVGGSSVMFIASKDLSKILRIPEFARAMPSLTRPALISVPYVGIAASAFLVGSWLLFKRKQDVKKLVCDPDQKDCDGGKQE